VCVDSVDDGSNPRWGLDFIESFCDAAASDFEAASWRLVIERFDRHVTCKIGRKVLLGPGAGGQSSQDLQSCRSALFISTRRRVSSVSLRFRGYGLARGSSIMAANSISHGQRRVGPVEATANWTLSGGCKKKNHVVPAGKGASIALDLQVVQAGRRVSSNADHGPATIYKNP